MIISPFEAIERVAARTSKNAQDIAQKNKQRRYSVVDSNGMEFTRLGDVNAPARFYISVSPDMVYYHRFEFKLNIQPFTTTVSGGTDAVVVAVDDTSLEIQNGQINPNPHKHTTIAHSHNIVSGITPTPVTATVFGVKVEGIDITPYLAAQYNDWIDGEGVWPSLDIEKDYDILQVANDLRAEGRYADAAKLVKAGYKAVEITANGPFQVTLVLYLKYDHLNR